VPAGAETILKERYGEDYMQIPPEGKRARHALIELKVREDI